MPARKKGSVREVGSDLARVEKHRIKPVEYDELPELTDAMVALAKANKGGRPKLTNPRQLITLRLPADVIARWRATGPGWQTRMAARISEATPKPRRASRADER
ncbi:MAG: BrnA antitoxin family protein [Gammaproteobacteria bacterium]